MGTKFWCIRPKGEKAFCACELKEDALACAGDDYKLNPDEWELYEREFSNEEFEQMGEFDGW